MFTDKLILYVHVVFLIIGPLNLLLHIKLF